KKEIPEIEKTLPAGVRINPFYDRTELIQACIRTVSDALLQGGILVILVLFLFLGDFRAALTVALSLPLMVSVAFVLMGWKGITANLMSLGGLAIAVGLIADGAIIVAENITRHLQDSSGRHLPKNIIAAQALKEIIRPLFFAICVIVVAVLPLFSLQAHEGKMFKPLAMAVLFAMVGSLIVSMTIVPILTSLLTKRGQERERRDLILQAILAVHRPVLRLALWGGWSTLAVAAAILVASFALIPGIGTEFLPALDEGAIAINVVRLPSAGLEGSKIQALLMERRLKERFPEIESVVSKTGRAEIAEDPMGPEQNDLILSLKPKDQWTSARTKDELVRLISLELAKIPGIRPAFSQPIALRVNELISGIKSDVAIKILGDDLEELQSIGAEIAPILSTIEGAEDVKLEQVSGFSQTEIQYDRRSLARHGISVSEVNEIIETAVGGRVATELYEGQRKIAVLVRFPEQFRRDRETLERLLVVSPMGYRVPLADLAEIVEVDAPAQISRENSQRRLLVECNVRGRDIGGFIREAQECTQEISDSLPEGYRLVWGGQFENQQRAAARLRIVVPIALLLIFVLLYTSLNSLKSAFLVYMNLPFAVVGGLLALHVLGINFSVAASIGFIALLGVAVEDGLLLVSFFDQLLANGYPVREAVFEGCRLRLRSLLMTTMTTVLGLLP
ncbi:MAG TPA: efflux RND transporter permease subunit, partial [bacterium]|nr:efflux RND transporter permease subunit [bacterium]